MRNMSFIMTTEAFKNGTKTVTRRLGWWNVAVGERLMGVQKCQGFKKGEHIVRLHPIIVKNARGEMLKAITKAEVVREGFPDMDPAEFVGMYVKHNWAKCKKDRERTVVNRIQFEHLALCPGCLYPVAHLGDYCGECLCEEDGI
jgi:hypothetical protein